MEPEHTSIVAAQGRSHRHQVQTASITGVSPLTIVEFDHWT